MTDTNTLIAKAQAHADSAEASLANAKQAYARLTQSLDDQKAKHARDRAAREYIDKANRELRAQQLAWWWKAFVLLVAAIVLLVCSFPKGGAQ